MRGAVHLLKEKGTHAYLFIMMMTSSVVLIEPAPYDLLMITFLIIGFLELKYKFPYKLFGLVSIFLLTVLFSSYFSEDGKRTLVYGGITFYLLLSFIGIASMQLKSKALKAILDGYLYTAILSAIIGIISYLHLIPGSDSLLMYGRAKAFFKDPNVYGPFLVFPALYCLSLWEMNRTGVIRRSFSLIGFIVIVMAIILSFSRAAMANALLAFALYLVIAKRDALRQRLTTLVILMVVGLPFLFYFIQTPAIYDLIETRLSYQHYDNHRFMTQKLGIDTAILYPFGIGSGQSENFFPQATHSLYVRVLVENGVLGFISFLLIVVASLLRAFKYFWKGEEDHSALFLIVFCALIGQLFNGFFVDSLHWRHFWILLALSWISPGMSNNKKI